ncbi:aminotransferase class V-fold PLP-dependent enzyme [Megasphaera cerevisiae]|nr:aminotransferase class V-fold PLP-dependent enzyme [Megasphaera cerevisiae]SJZ75939.1 Selenocysteine lyase [Megasphaera cerevisiae DSM 20462]
MQYLLPRLREIPGIHIYSAPLDDMAQQAGVISFAVDGWRAVELAAFLDYAYDIAVRAGHHCAAFIHKYLRDDTFGGTVRVSISIFTTQADLEQLLTALKSLDRTVLKAIPAEVLRGLC